MKRETFERYGEAALEYNPEDGSFKFKEISESPYQRVDVFRSWNARCAGKVAGKFRSDYVILRLFSAEVPAHHYVWFLETGVWPRDILDHIDGNGHNNRFSNLREADQSLNRMNQRRRSDNASGVTGVYYNRSTRKWVAQIIVRGKHSRLGSFEDFDKAVEVRREAQAAAGFGPNHGALPQPPRPRGRSIQADVTSAVQL